MALQVVDRFLAAVADCNGSGEHAAKCVNEHLSGLVTDGLPSPAHDTWRKATHLLRTSADRAIPEKITHAMRSWPQSRVAELIGHVRDLRAILEKIENDRLEDEIRDSIRRHYL